MLWSLILAAAIAPQAGTAVPGPEAYVGRWNVRITAASDTFVSGGFQITLEDGALAAGLVWRWGSYLPARSVEVKNGVLRIVREARPGRLDSFEARLEGERLVGQVTYPDGAVHHFEGRGERPRCCSTSGRPCGASRSRSSTARRSPAGSCATPGRTTAGRR